MNSPIEFSHFHILQKLRKGEKDTAPNDERVVGQIIHGPQLIL